MTNYIKNNETNKTKLIANKEILQKVLTSDELKVFLLSACNEIYKDKEILNKQKVVSLKNLVKDIKLNIDNKNLDYNLNLVLRNLNEYHAFQKLEIKDKEGKVTNYIPSNEIPYILSSLIFLAFSSTLAKIVKNIYTKKIDK